MELNIEAYARVMAELADAGEAREEVLERHGLDEARWTAIDAHWQAQLSNALAEEGDGLPALFAAYEAAYEAAQRSLGSPISLEQFAEVTRLLHATSDIRAALARVGVTLADYIRATEHWSRLLAEDPSLDLRFETMLRRG